MTAESVVSAVAVEDALVGHILQRGSTFTFSHPLGAAGRPGSRVVGVFIVVGGVVGAVLGVSILGLCVGNVMVATASTRAAFLARKVVQAPTLPALPTLGGFWLLVEIRESGKVLAALAEFDHNVPPHTAPVGCVAVFAHVFILSGDDTF
jgi:hypothetical protein